MDESKRRVRPTLRSLEAVTEGAGATQQEGSGIKIVTVQIREALVLGRITAAA